MLLWFVKITGGRIDQPMSGCGPKKISLPNYKTNMGQAKSVTKKSVDAIESQVRLVEC